MALARRRFLTKLPNAVNPEPNRNSDAGSGTGSARYGRALHHQIVDPVVARSRRRSIEDDPERRVRVVVQANNAAEVERKQAEGGSRTIRRSKVYKRDSIQAVLELIAVKARGGTLRGEGYDDVCVPERYSD